MKCEESYTRYSLSRLLATSATPEHEGGLRCWNTMPAGNA